MIIFLINTLIIKKKKSNFIVILDGTEWIYINYILLSKIGILNLQECN
jgi:hypothetical protein